MKRIVGESDEEDCGSRTKMIVGESDEEDCGRVG